MKIRIGTRKSKLAVAQAKMTAAEISKKFPEAETEMVYITTKGDKIIDKPLTSIGGKGVFVSEIEQALQSGVIDIAVHSAKDLPLQLGENLEITAVLKRGDYRDVLITRKEFSIENSSSFKVGTGSMRRRMYLGKIYPGAVFAEIRGNVDTRLNKLADGNYDGIVLAMAGLKRLALHNDERFDFLPFNYDKFLPAPCQGIIAVESRKNDIIGETVKSINDSAAFCSFRTERFIIEALGADCGVPLGAYSFTENGNITAVVSVDSEKVIMGTDSESNCLKLAKELISCL